MATDTPVIIVGAGPSGLTAALFLVDAGVPVQVLESRTEIYEDPRAATFHPPTMEMYEKSGITQMLHDQGILCPRWQFHSRSEGLVAEFDLSVLSDVTKFPYRLQCEQHKLVRMLTSKLEGRQGFSLRYGAEVENVTQDHDGVTVTVAGGDTYRGQYVIGADGGRSVVRKSQDIDFQGFTYQERFLVITTTHDFEPYGYAYSCYIADPREWCSIFKVPAKGPPGLWRAVFPTKPEDSAEFLLDHVEAEKRLQGFLPKDSPYEVVHTNLYTVHQRVADTYRNGRALLAGDAAHVNNPLGGMGMNFGIHDAVSLAQKLARVLNGESDELLNLYDRQRRHVAKEFLQAMTIANKRNLEEKDPAVLKQRQDELRAIASDPVKAKTYLLRTAMIEGLRVAEAIK